MPAPDLAIESQADGETLIAQLRLSNVEVFAAIWIYRADIEAWELALVSPQTESRGPKYLLRVTNDILQKIDKKSSLSFFDVSFQSPRSHGVMEVKSVLDQIGIHSSTRLRLRDVKIGSKIIESMFIYMFDEVKIAEDNMLDLRLAAE